MGGTHRVKGGTGKAEAAKLPDAGISPKQCPGKCAAEKGDIVLNSRRSCGEQSRTVAEKWDHQGKGIRCARFKRD